QCRLAPISRTIQTRITTRASQPSNLFLKRRNPLEPYRQNNRNRRKTANSNNSSSRLRLPNSCFMSYSRRASSNNSNNHRNRQIRVDLRLILICLHNSGRPRPGFSEELPPSKGRARDPETHVLWQR